MSWLSNKNLSMFTRLASPEGLLMVYCTFSPSARAFYGIKSFAPGLSPLERAVGSLFYFEAGFP